MGSGSHDRYRLHELEVAFVFRACMRENAILRLLGEGLHERPRLGVGDRIVDRGGVRDRQRVGLLEALGQLYLAAVLMPAVSIDPGPIVWSHRLDDQGIALPLAG